MQGMGVSAARHAVRRALLPTDVARLGDLSDCFPLDGTAPSVQFDVWVASPTYLSMDVLPFSLTVPQRLLAV